MTDDPLGWLDYVPVGSDRSTDTEILLCFERTMLCDERLPEDYRHEVRERIWRHIKKSPGFDRILLEMRGRKR
jgi:hypothetical protein